MSKIFRRWFTVNLIVIGAVLVVTITSLLLLRRDISSRVAAFTEERNKFIFRTEGIKSLASLREETVRGREYFNELASLLPKEEGLFALTRVLDRFAKARNVNLNFAFGSKNPASGNIAPSIAFRIIADGNYDNILKFLGDMENEKLLIKLNNIDIVKGGGSSYNARISGQIYTKP